MSTMQAGGSRGSYSGTAASQPAHAPARLLTFTDPLRLGFVRRQGMRGDRGGNAGLAQRQKKDECDNQTKASGTLP
jgi:hypothetical protein